MCVVYICCAIDFYLANFRYKNEFPKTCFLDMFQLPFLLTREKHSMVGEAIRNLNIFRRIKNGKTLALVEIDKYFLKYIFCI